MDNVMTGSDNWKVKIENANRASSYSVTEQAAYENLVNLVLWVVQKKTLVSP